MRLIKPSATTEHVTPDALQLIERAGRTCYKSEDKITDGSAEKFVRMLIKRGHEAMLEHAHATVRIVCDRGVTHELVRHRIGVAYAMESSRYVSYAGGVTFIIPPWIDLPPGEWADIPKLDEFATEDDCFWARSMYDAEEMYRVLIERWTPQQARAVLPNSLKTEIVVTANLREWRHIFKLRTAPDAHPQIREVMIMARDELQKQIPVVFEQEV